jgi:predicted PolB exonuclease-like 3'-5' exonuclease
MNIKPTPSRRNVVIDIETISLDPNDPKGALSAINGRVVCICLLIDDGTQMREVTIIGTSETGMLRNFWACVHQADVFIGHNAWGYDFPFLLQRSWILGVRPSRKVDLRKFYTQEVLDTQMIYSVWGTTKYPSLDKLAGALGCGSKTGDGSEVAEWWHAGKIEQIAEYCRHDVRITYLVFLRLMFISLPARLAALGNYHGADPSCSDSTSELEDLSSIPEAAQLLH